MGKFNIEDFSFGGRFHDYCWNPSYNPNATIENGLANCTTMSFAFSLILHFPTPVKRIVSAGNWHRVLDNDYTYYPYGTCQIKVGDILEWSDHVATVIEIKEGEPIVGSSWYTGEHGKSIYDGKYDTRNFSSLKELSDFMIQNYPYRFYHECSLYDESNMVGGLPLYVLKGTEFSPVERDESKNQIEVLTDEQNIRKDGKVIGVAKKGYYNVLSIKEDNLLWYEIQPNLFIAQVDNRVKYLPCTYKEEIEILREKLRRIKEIIDE